MMETPPIPRPQDIDSRGAFVSWCETMRAAGLIEAPPTQPVGPPESGYQLFQDKDGRVVRVHSSSSTAPSLYYVSHATLSRWDPAETVMIVAFMPAGLNLRDPDAVRAALNADLPDPARCGVWVNNPRDAHRFPGRAIYRKLGSGSGEPCVPIHPRWLVAFRDLWREACASPPNPWV